ncbi:hypothetical protein AB5I41_15210 [Sphingomonas sp. MMS24-JH45]
MLLSDGDGFLSPASIATMTAPAWTYDGGNGLTGEAATAASTVVTALRCRRSRRRARDAATIPSATDGRGSAMPATPTGCARDCGSIARPAWGRRFRHRGEGRRDGRRSAFSPQEAAGSRAVANGSPRQASDWRSSAARSVSPRSTASPSATARASASCAMWR